MNRWKEYDDGALTPPCVVQRDIINGENQVWVWTGSTIVGPLTQVSDEDAIAIAISNNDLEQPQQTDPYQDEIATMQATIDDLQANLDDVSAKLDDTQSVLIANNIPIDTKPIRVKD